jgi:hypothetical protein
MAHGDLYHSHNIPEVLPALTRLDKHGADSYDTSGAAKIQEDLRNAVIAWSICL